jgi:hypothetical protein
MDAEQNKSRCCPLLIGIFLWRVEAASISSFRPEPDTSVEHIMNMLLIGVRDGRSEFWGGKSLLEAELTWR